jgi:hypothetical protein
MAKVNGRRYSAKFKFQIVLAGFFTLVLPAIVIGELVWGREPFSFWSYLRATDGDLWAAARAHLQTVNAVTLGAAVAYQRSSPLTPSTS